MPKYVRWRVGALVLPVVGTLSVRYGVGRYRSSVIVMSTVSLSQARMSVRATRCAVAVSSCAPPRRALSSFGGGPDHRAIGLHNMPRFHMEKLAGWEHAAHQLAASDCEPLLLAELLELADDSCRERWDKLSLGYPESAGDPVRPAPAYRPSAIDFWLGGT